MIGTSNQIKTGMSRGKSGSFDIEKTEEAVNISSSKFEAGLYGISCTIVFISVLLLFFIIHDVWAKSNHALLKIDKNIEKKSF